MKKYLFSLLFIFWFFVPGHSQTITSEGTDFWIAFPPNLTINDYDTLSIFISSNFSTSGNISSAYPGVNQSFTVVPGVVTQLIVPTGISLQTGIENKGIEITSVDPVTVYALNRQPASTDAYLALPITALGSDYRIVTYKVTYPTKGSCFSIVATQNGTSLTIFNHQSNSTSNINLDQGQTYHISESQMDDDVTGSRVQSNHPVAVFASVDALFIPNYLCFAADHIVEQMFPYYSWGKNFLTVPLAGRDNSGDIFRIVAADDGTDISINGTIVSTINAGDYYEANLVGLNSITTSKATILAQFAKSLDCSGDITGDPFMMLIPPREQFLTHYTVVNVAGFTTHWINVVAPGYALGTIYQDGVLIPDTAFAQIGSTNYYGAQRKVNSGSHTFNSTFPFGVFVYGWNQADSYGYPGGCSLSPVGTVNSVTLSPDTAYGQLNVTNVCLTAHVTDNLSAPVPGVLVNFYISGCNPLTGNAYTDAAGDAQYCYIQTGAASCTDNVYAEVFGFTSGTSTVIWSYTPPCVNPLNGGTIGDDQTGCGSFTPSVLHNILLPTGQTGTLEYKWQLSTTSSSSGFTDIPGSNTASYNPGSISQTSWYKRIARVACMPDWSGSVESNVIEMTVNTPLPVSVTVSASVNNVCAGTPVMFTAIPTNGGTTPSFLWKVNGISVGTNSPTYSYIPVNGDLVTCILTSSEQCTSSNPASSIPFPVSVSPLLPVSITISPSANPFCVGSPVTFTATPMNGGTTPSYQWKVNGINAGTNSPNYTYTPANGDMVYCILTSSELCSSSNPASSISLTLIQIISLPAGVSIAASSNPFCPGSSVTFTASPVNGGSTPFYQWKINGINAGTNSSTFIYNPANNDSVHCVMTSYLSCVTGSPAGSAKIIMLGTLAPIVSFTSCFDTITTINAKPIKLKGGIPLGGAYSGPGVNSLTGIYTPALAGVGTHTITYTYTNVVLCSASKSISILNLPSSILNCGNPLTDVRDNKVYQTIQIGSQCWLATNLNFGTILASSQDQRDNCVAEKYCYNDNPINCANHGGLYQWDELMLFNETPDDQGFCPPGWHIPTENEWNVLFANYINSGFAGSPLKYSGYSGFNALLSGARHINRGWNFQGFATFFWSSTLVGTAKAWAHGMNDVDPSVSSYPSSRANAFSVRCLKDF